MVMEDMYGNPVLPDTPTTRRLAQKSKQAQNKVESDGRFKLSTRIDKAMPAEKAASYLEYAAAQIREHKVAVVFEFTATEATK